MAISLSYHLIAFCGMPLIACAGNPKLPEFRIEIYNIKIKEYTWTNHSQDNIRGWYRLNQWVWGLVHYSI